MVFLYVGCVGQIFIQLIFFSFLFNFLPFIDALPLYAFLISIEEKLSTEANTTARLDREAIPKDHMSAPKIWDIMTKTRDRLLTNIRSRNFEKFIFVAHKDNGKCFSHEVPPLHFFNFFLSPLSSSSCISCIFLYSTFFYFGDSSSFLHLPRHGYDY